MSLGTGLDALIKLRHLLIDRREQRRWFLRWSLEAARRTLASLAGPEAIQARSQELREWALAQLAQRRRDDAVEESPLVDPRFLLLQHICWAFDFTDDVAEAEALLGYTDREFEALGPFREPDSGEGENPGSFGSAKGQ